MLDLLLHHSMLNPFVAVIIASIISSVVGAFTVLKGFSTLSAAITHSSFAGASIAAVYGVNPLLGALAMSLGFSGITAYVSQGNERKADVFIGMIFGLSTALAVLFLSLARTHTATAWSFIVGDVLGVSLIDLYTLMIVAASTLCLVALFYDEFKFITFDPEGAEAMGLRTSLYHYTMIILIALFSVVAIKVVGIILAVVLLIAPAASAYEFSHNLERLLLLSLLISISSGISGFILSLILNVTTSALIGITASVAYLLALLVSPKRRKCKELVRFRRRIVKEL
ncbi:MAG: metal ABC transporter permease [Candidatus Nezhaarchaeales archaeon]